MSSFFSISPPVLLAILIFGIFLISVFWKYRNFVIFGFCILFFVFGIFRYQSFLSKLENSEIKNFLNENVTLIGIVDGEPSIREKTIKLKIKIEGTGDKILITTRRYPEYQYGDKLKITGKLEEPQAFEGFNYKNYLLKDGILAVINFPEIELIEKDFGSPTMKILFSFKNKLKESLNSLISPPQSALLEALIFGDEENISKDWKEKLNLTGTRHIAAVSGMNITIISGLILSFLLLLGFWRNQAFYLSIILIILYILMIGAPASAIRAGIMGILFLTAQHFGRLSSGQRPVFLAAALMLFLNPLLLPFDIGFQLSFLATLGLVYWQPIFSDFLKKFSKFLGLRNNLSTTLAAQTFTFPILIYNFGIIPIFSPFINIFILPLIPLVTIFGFVFSFVGIFSQILGQILSWPAWLISIYILKVIGLSSEIPSLIFKNVHWLFLPISYLILGFITWRLQESQKLKFLKY